jgi:hypothetical protein
MANLSKKLEILFRQYLIRKEKERNVPVVYHSPHTNWMNDTERYDGVIYFYEWSDPDRAPQLFYNIGAFDSFLRRSEIFMPPFQKDIIRQLDRAYITCKKGTHDLLIRGGLGMLRDAVAQSNAQGVDLQTAGKAILSSPPPPPMTHNPMAMQYQGSRQPPMYNGYPDEWYC